jgi:chaperonin GroES
MLATRFVFVSTSYQRERNTPSSPPCGIGVAAEHLFGPIFCQRFNLGVSMKLRPLHDRVIVKRLEEERKTASGIVIPDTVAEKPDQGEILAVGNGKVGDDGKVRALDVKVGDKVLFGKYSGQTVKVDGEELLVMREEDIMAVVGK